MHINSRVLIKNYLHINSRINFPQRELSPYSTEEQMSDELSCERFNGETSKCLLKPQAVMQLFVQLLAAIAGGYESKTPIHTAKRLIGSR